MGAARLASLGGLAVAALLVALWLRDDDDATHAAPEMAPPVAVTPAESPRPAAVAPLAPAEPTGKRPGEAELRAQATQESYARVGSALVDYLVERGLARVDGEPVVRR